MNTDSALISEKKEAGKAFNTLARVLLISYVLQLLVSILFNILGEAFGETVFRAISRLLARVMRISPENAYDFWCDFWYSDAMWEFSDILYQIVFLLLPFLVYLRRVPTEHKPLFSLHGRMKTNLFSYLFFAMSCSAVFSTLLNSVWNLGYTDYYVSDIDTYSPFALAIMVIASVFVAPLIEEMIFRGIAIRALEPFGKTVAVIGSALLFASVHSADSMLFAFVFGIVMAYVSVCTDNIKTSLFFHMFNNLMCCVLDYVSAVLSPEAAQLVLTVYDILLFTLGMIGILMIIREISKNGIWSNGNSVDTDIESSNNGNPALWKVYGFKLFLVPSFVIYFLLSLYDVLVSVW